MKYRSLRVQNLIREELGKIIVRELEFPNALPTITEVEVDKKFSTAVVRVSVIPIAQAPKSIKTLQDAQGRLQHLLLKKINVKPMPRIRFELDRGPENAANVERRLLEDS